MRRILAFVPLIMLAACEQPYRAPILYQAQTPDCRNWSDGSRFELPSSISVFASAPVSSADGSVQLHLAYFIPRGQSVRFSNQEFAISAPKGPAFERGVVTLVDRAAVNAPTHKTEVLASLPLKLDALEVGDETMVRATVQFAKALKRFDLMHPQMTIDGKSYPVRTYTYRWFEDRGKHGLCT
jgi:hypothetical protein